MKIKFKIIKEEHDLTIGKEKQRLIKVIINKLCSISNTMLYRLLDFLEGR